MNRLRRQRGFTLLELMVALFVLGIILAIAIPSYVSYLGRTKIAAGYSLTSEPRRRIEEIWNIDGKLPQTSEEAGYEPIEPDSMPYVERVEIVGGAIEVEYTGSRLLRNGLLVVSPQVSGVTLTWTCLSPNLPLNLLPKGCR